MKKIILSAIMLVFCLSATAQAASDASTPVKAIAMMQKAIDSKDAALADSLLDYDSVVNSFITETLPQINEAAAKGLIELPSPLDMVLFSLNTGNRATQKTATALLTSEAKKFTDYGVASGSFAGKPVEADKIKNLDGGLFLQFGGISPYKKEFGKAELKEMNGNEAVVATSLKDYGTGGRYPLELRMVKEGDTWKAVKLENAVSLFTQMMEEAGQN